MAGGVGCSHTTISATFSSPRLPSWGVVELLVETLGGDPQEFRSLWLAASAPSDGDRAGDRSKTAQIAGRRAELTVVRRHLEAGAGLLLVVGDAGIGKSRLVGVAAAGVDCHVAEGHCLPLTREVPLLPFVDALRAIHGVEGGRWLREAVDSCPAYVAATLSRLLPELEAPSSRPPEDEWSRHRLFAAFADTLSALRATRPLALLVEDLHWADTATLDLIEHLVSRGADLPLVCTWRDDAETGADQREWSARLRRSRNVRVVQLPPLTRDETAVQLELLRDAPVDARVVDQVHARARGNPLFAEQLADQPDDSAELPRLLADLLDQRLDRLDAESWQVARALGIAERPLPFEVLHRVAGLPLEVIISALHRLTDHRLLARSPLGASDGWERTAQLAHPLLDEAVRRRLVAGEAAEQHRRLAVALAETQSGEPSEIAWHWQSAGDPLEELGWRITAARDAHQRLGPEQEGEHWLRALDLWPPHGEPMGSPPLSRVRAAFAAMCALEDSAHLDRAAAIAESLLPYADQLPDAEAAELLAMTADYRGVLDSPADGLALIERSVEIYEALPPSTELVRALRANAGLLQDLGHFDAAASVIDRALEVNRLVGDLDQSRRLLVERAWYDYAAGRFDEALAQVQAAAAVEPSGLDPFGEMYVAVHHAELLFEFGSSTADVVAAGRRGLDAAATWGIDSLLLSWLQCTLGTAMLRAGDVTGAAALLEPATDVEVVIDRQPAQVARADLDVRRGRLEDARARLARVAALGLGSLDLRTRWVEVMAAVDLWTGHPAVALERLLNLLPDLMVIDESAHSGGVLVLAARAAADSRCPTGEPAQLHAHLRTLHGSARRDPFAATGRPSYAAAEAETWAAELGRLMRTAGVEDWVRAAKRWDALERPHDAAYCRWRAAQVALASGRATAATRLLRGAAADARQHVPLSQVIAATARRSPR
jgi:tetratricopeptide (TPR) repeat protein